MIARDQITYLDNNATTQLDQAVVDEMLPFLTESVRQSIRRLPIRDASAKGDRTGARACGKAA